MIPKLPKGFSHPMAVGQGSFSFVYRARQNALDRWVAIKILAEKAPERRLELIKEAKRQAQIRIGCIPAVYDAFEWGQQLCIVMQWVKGVPLLTLMEKGLAPEDRIRLAAALTAALAGLHRAGFAHRDLKPANILVSPEEGVFLVDFGFVKKVGAGDESMRNMIIGTPAYMAPELWQGGEALDYLKADLFALGKILKQLSLGNDWQGLIQVLLAENPADRPASAVTVWEQWQSLLANAEPGDWKAMAGALTCESLARQLLLAARMLLHAKREEEAYWLLVECVEQSPDSTEALDLMDKFPALSRRKARLRKVWTAGAVLASMVVVALAFQVGRQSERSRIVPALTTREGVRSLLLPSRAATSPNRALVLKDMDAGKSDRLSGWLFLEDAKRCEHLTLDGKPLDLVTAAQGVPLSHGEHVILCLDRDQGLKGKERITLLPFQKKFLALNLPSSSGEVD